MTNPDWVALHPAMRPYMLGELPGMLDEDDPRPAREQFDANYRHGGGWRPFKGHTLNSPSLSLSYPGDPDMPALALTRLRDEVIIFSECSWVTIIQPDGSYETARMD
jgi:hypothetical protein